MLHGMRGWGRDQLTGRGRVQGVLVADPGPDPGAMADRRGIEPRRYGRWLGPGGRDGVEPALRGRGEVDALPGGRAIARLRAPFHIQTSGASTMLYAAHSGLRFLVLVGGLFVILYAAVGFFGKRRSEQSSLIRQIERIADTGGSLDENSLAHLRSVDSNLKRLVEESASGQEAFLQGMRSEIKLLARTLSTSVPATESTPAAPKATRRASTAAAKSEAKPRSTYQTRPKR